MTSKRILIAQARELAEDLDLPADPREAQLVLILVLTAHAAKHELLGSTIRLVKSAVAHYTKTTGA